MKKFIFLLVILIISSQLTFSQTALSHPNILYILPAEIDQIDGDLSDWPDQIPSYQIAKRIGGDPISSNSDFSASYKIAYSQEQNIIYLGIRIKDDEVVDNHQVDWRKQDAYCLYVDEQYQAAGSAVARYAWTLNELKELSDSAIAWDPKSSAYMDWKKVVHKSKSDNGLIIHEIAFELNEPIYKGRAIRLGHIVVDQDKNKRTFYGAIQRGGKDQTSRPGRVGTLIFADDQLSTGTLKGTVAWLDSTIRMYPGDVRIVSADNPDFWIYTRLSHPDRSFQVSLPAGNYLLQPGMKTFFSGMQYTKANISKTMRVTVKPGQTTNIGTYKLEPMAKPNFVELPKGLLIPNDKKINLIDQVVQKYMTYYEIEGVSFLAFKQGKVAYKKHYGFENAYAKTPIDDHSVFEVASITKPIVAFAALKLYEKGILDLDQPLHEIIPFNQISHQPYAKLLNARIILSHRSGLPNWPSNGQLNFMFKPGNNYSYSGSAYQYLGRVLEQLTGKDINTILQEEVCQPLGIKHFYFKENPYLTKHKVHGHSNGFPGVIDQDPAPWIAGSLVTSTEDLLKFVRAISQRKGLKKETFDLMLSQQIEIPQNTRENIWGHEEYMGLGFFVEKTPYGKVFKHSGNNGDFKAIFKLYDELDSGYILFTNGNTGHFIIENIERALVDPSKVK